MPFCFLFHFVSEDVISTCEVFHTVQCLTEHVNSEKSQILAHNPLFFYSPGSLLAVRSMVLICSKSQPGLKTCTCLLYSECSFSCNPILLLFRSERLTGVSFIRKRIFVEKENRPSIISVSIVFTFSDPYFSSIDKTF